jgi:hypothetical protein
MISGKNLSFLHEYPIACPGYDMSFPLELDLRLVSGPFFAAVSLSGSRNTAPVMSGVITRILKRAVFRR